MPLRLAFGVRIPTTTAPPTALLGALLRYQGQKQWCWAACVEMILDYYSIGHSGQCGFAEWLFGQKCCGSPGAPGCNKPCAVADVSRIYCQWGLACKTHLSTVGIAVVQQEVNQGRPVQVGFSLSSSGHLALIIGHGSDAGGAFVMLHDPEYGTGSVHTGYLSTAYGLGTWRWTWTGIQ